MNRTVLLKMILLTNDDGIHARGLLTLAKTLREIDRLVIIAPDRERSAVAHSFTMNHPIRAHRLEEDVIMIDGTPTDCVMLGVLGYLAEKPTIVVAGINSGANMGDDVTYSGTVAAALEGTLLGLPSIAVSLENRMHRAHSPAEKTDLHYETAACFAGQLVKRVMQTGLPKGILLNANVPNLPHDQIAGVRVTRLGKRIYNDRIERRVDPQGREYFWLAGEIPGYHAEEGTDFAAVEANCISVTPLRFEMTSLDSIPQLQDQGYQDGWTFVISST
ncbi:MAG TPA: 5'/3'-nucleotidase SurE [bacterium]|nr:5'/3'-nucleotidase SurE [bacterium]